MKLALSATYKGWTGGINAGGGNAEMNASMAENAYKEATFRTVVRMMIHV
jgi:hypothetical protein